MIIRKFIKKRNFSSFRYYEITQTDNEQDDKSFKKILNFDKETKKISIENVNHQINNNNNKQVDSNKSLFKKYLLPKNYKESVLPEYKEYCYWAIGSSIFGTTCSVLSLQALLVSMSLSIIPDDNILPVAATINWVLKDGLGQLGGVMFGGLINQRFDSYPKRYRFLAESTLAASVLLESITPLFPALFLPLASTANVGKNIAWLSASATRASINKSFCLKENLGDLTVKAGSQTIFASLLGTGLGIFLTPYVGATGSPLVIGTILSLSSLQLYCTYKSLKHVKLKSLNPQRLWLAANNHNDINKVNDKELIVNVETTLLFNKGKAFLQSPNNNKQQISVYIGPHLHEFSNKVYHLENSFKLCEKYNDKYLIKLDYDNNDKLQVQILIDEQATEQDVILSYGHACEIAKYIYKDDENKDSYNEQELYEITEKTKRIILFDYVDNLSTQGWDTNYSYLEENKRRIKISQTNFFEPEFNNNNLVLC